MRCHYMSDLHLETQEFLWPLPEGDVMIIAGDLAHARCLDPARTDLYCVRQRDRVRRLMDGLARRFKHVLLIVGNHDHYDGVLEETAELFDRHLPEITVLDDEAVEIGGVRFYGTTLWSDFEGRNRAVMDGIRRKIGDFFFIKTRKGAGGGEVRPVKFGPEAMLAQFDRSCAALKSALAQAPALPTVIVSHHAPSAKGANPLHVGNGLDGAYFSRLDALVESLPNVRRWVHGHTHIERRYAIADTKVHVNCRGFDGRDAGARGFKPDTWFEIGA